MKMYIIITDKTSKTDKLYAEGKYDEMRKEFMHLLEKQVLSLYKKGEHKWRHITNEYESIIVIMPNDKYFTDNPSGTDEDKSKIFNIPNSKEEILREIDKRRKQGII